MSDITQTATTLINKTNDPRKNAQKIKAMSTVAGPTIGPAADSMAAKGIKGINSGPLVNNKTIGAALDDILESETIINTQKNAGTKSPGQK